MRHIRLLAITLILVSVLTQAAVADVGAFAAVKGTSALNVRSGPGTEYGKIGTVARGGWVEITGGSGTWSLINAVGTALSGYVSNNFLDRVDLSAPVTATVNNPRPTQFLNLRQSPSYSATVLGIYYNGAVGTVLSENGGWYYVSIDGKLGYFRGEYLSLSGGYSGTGTAVIRTPNNTKMNMRSGPAYTYPVTRQYAAGSSVAVLLKGNVFWMVSAGGDTGFMASSFLSAGNPDSGTGGYGIVSNPLSYQKLNLREQASTSSRVLAQYGNGTRVEILNQGVEWCRVSVELSGITGFVQTKYLTLHNLPVIPVKTVYNPSGSYVNLRSVPNKSSGTVYAQVPSGNSVTILTPGAEWSQVLYGTRAGYMMTGFLR